MTIPVTFVDAFADGPFTGNPAAVCLLPNASATATWMQAVARELNLSETAFLSRGTDGFDLRWFTPSIEVDLCGHATLAGAHVLWERGVLDRSEVARFRTRSGLLSAEIEGDHIALDFPATPAVEADVPPGLLDALGVAPVWAGRNQTDCLVEVASEADVRRVQPDLAQLRQLPIRGVIVTSLASSAGWDFVSRFFAPAAGIDEDPVTGSAHCALAPYWSRRLGRAALVGRQLSDRGGTVHVTDVGDRVRLAGRAVTILRGELPAEGDVPGW